VSNYSFRVLAFCSGIHTAVVGFIHHEWWSWLLMIASGACIAVYEALNEKEGK
jgi:diacylglycerol kinase